MRFSLIIVTKGRAQPLAAALESAASALPADGELIVVDGDQERSAEAVTTELRARHRHLDVRYVPSDPGVALQRNVGLDVASGDVIVYVDDDCTFGPGLFEALMRTYCDPAVVGATGRIDGGLSRSRLGSNPNSRLRWLLLGGGRQGSMTSFGFRRPIVDPGQPRDVEFMPGPLMSARRNVAAEVRFDEQLTGYSLVEDDDFSFRLSRRGRIRYEPLRSSDTTNSAGAAGISARWTACRSSIAPTCSARTFRRRSAPGPASPRSSRSSVRIAFSIVSGPVCPGCWRGSGTCLGLPCCDRRLPLTESQERVNDRRLECPLAVHALDRAGSAATGRVATDRIGGWAGHGANDERKWEEVLRGCAL